MGIAGGVKLFDADTLELLSEVSTRDEATGVASKVVGLADLPGNRFAFSLFEAGAIWVIDASNPRAPKVTQELRPNPRNSARSSSC